MQGEDSFDVEYVNSNQFGELAKADAVVPQRFAPKDFFTTNYVDDLLESIGINLGDERPSSVPKLRYAMSDFLVGARQALKKNALLAWPMSNDAFTGSAYNAELARRVLKGLMAEGLMWVEQQQSKRDGLGRVYGLDSEIVPAKLSFEHHGKGDCVVVRSAKTSLWEDSNRATGGKRMSRKKFLGQIEPLEEQVTIINRCFLRHPLQFWDGREFAWCRRIFNDGRLDHGGRLYGDWQYVSEDERIASTIDGCAVCEIDLKASYPSIINATLGTINDLGEDPYREVQFVKEAPDLRGLAKDLISAYVSKGSEMSQFPKGVRSRHGVKGSVGVYMEQIFHAMPFLRGIHHVGVNWMYVESVLVVSVIEELAKQDVAAYPVHDSFLVKMLDKDQAIKILHDKMMEHLGVCIRLDVSYFDEDAEKIAQPIMLPVSMTPNLKPTFDFRSYGWGLQDNVIDLED
jgi:hypothetical protein